jgi:predicted enzyme related to lactoylglutathione lyase
MDTSLDTPSNEGRIDYIEFPAADIVKTKAFYSGLFGWKFTDYGPDYTSFEDGRLAGGFFKKDAVAAGGPLIVIYTADLAGMQVKVAGAGGAIVKEIFSFPGGRRFHFSDPSGNELAVWSDK